MKLFLLTMIAFTLSIASIRAAAPIEVMDNNEVLKTAPTSGTETYAFSIIIGSTATTDLYSSIFGSTTWQTAAKPNHILTYIENDTAQNIMMSTYAVSNSSNIAAGPYFYLSTGPTNISLNVHSDLFLSTLPNSGSSITVRGMVTEEKFQ